MAFGEIMYVSDTIEKPNATNRMTSTMNFWWRTITESLKKTSKRPYRNIIFDPFPTENTQSLEEDIRSL